MDPVLAQLLADQPPDRDTLIEEAIEARLRTHALLPALCEVIPYPDDIESLGRAQQRGIVLIRAYQDESREAPVQGARRDKVRQVSLISIELRFLVFDRRSRSGVGMIRGFCRDALAGFKPEIAHPNYEPIAPLVHERGGLVGRIKGSKRWDYFDAYLLEAVYETRPDQYPKAS